MNIPFGALALILSVRNLKDVGKKTGDAPPFDLSGYISFIIFIILFQFSIARIEKTGINSWQFYTSFIISLISLFIFIKIDKKKKDPVLDLSLFSERTFNAGIMVTAVRSVALFGGLFLLPFLLEKLMNFTEIQTGLLLLPASAVLAILMPLAGKYADKHGARNISVAGLILVGISTVMLMFIGKGTSIVPIIISVAIRGAGLAFLFSPVSAAVINSVPKEKSATASTYYSLFMQIGGSVGIGLLAVLHQYLLGYFKAAGKDMNTASQHALAGGFLLSAIIIVLAIWPACNLQREPGKDDRK